MPGLIPVETLGAKPTKICTQLITIEIQGQRKGNTYKN